MNYNYLQQGGLASLPTRPILGGEQHELSYITPEEAQLLRRHGGGVTPSGGQYTGPGGLPAFFGHGHGQPNFSPDTHGKSGFSNVHDMNPYSVQTNVDFSVESGGKDPQSKQFNPQETIKSAKRYNLNKKRIADAKAKKKNPLLSYTDDKFNKDPYGRRVPFNVKAYKGHLADQGFAEGFFSQTNILGDALSRDSLVGDPTGFFGEDQGFLNSKTGESFSIGDIADANPSDFSGTGKFAGSEFGFKGDAFSPFGRLSLGLVDIIGMVAPPIGLLGNILSVGKLAGLVDLPSIGDVGLMSLIGDQFSVGDDGETVTSAVSDFGDSVVDSLGLSSIGDAFSSALGLTSSDSITNPFGAGDQQSNVEAAESDSTGFIGDALAAIGLTGTDAAPIGQPPNAGGGPGIQQLPAASEEVVDSIVETPTFRTDFEERESSTESQIPITIEEILAKYVSPSQATISAYGGGGIQGLLDKSNKEYSVQNQDRVPSFNKATPHPELMSGSDGYISNILQGHTVPMGMTNNQQMQKPLDAFPTGGQMNSDNTLHANYSQPQSFYSMPNMNRVN
jgi:hypothetical protein